MKFLTDEQNSRFAGDGSVNAQGQTLRQFLEDYDPRRYLNPSNTVDMLIFTYAEREGVRQLKRLLLIKRSNHPCIGMWATPGGFVEFKESLDAAARRELEEETGITGVPLVQLKSYGDYDRDPRTRIITTAYIALIPDEAAHAQAGDDAKDAQWFDIAFDEEAKEDDGSGTLKYRLKLELTMSSGDEQFGNDLCGDTARTGETACGSLTLTAVVDKTVHTDTILKNADYRLVKSCGLAADHGAIITEAIDYVKDKL